MTEDDLRDKLLGRLLREPEFREKLFNHPEEALAEAGIEPKPEYVRQIQSASKERVDELAKAYADRFNNNQGPH